MAALKLIIKKIINTDNNIFSTNYDTTDKVNKIIKSLFFYFISKEINIKSKFEFFFETTQNTFFKNILEDFIHYFCKIQKTYNGFNKLAKIYKYKKTSIVVDADIALNEIKENQPNVFSVIQVNSKYLFSINDLINIINASLTNNYQFFVEPLCVKNPYNNIPFSKSTLYNIYFFILGKTHYRPDLFFKFFACDFNLSHFGKKYEVLLREHYIYNYVYKSTSDLLFKEVTKMIRYFNNYSLTNGLKNKIHVDADFPKDKLIKIMQPYLLLYFTSIYSMILNKKSETRVAFKYMMLRFSNYNPQFGRKKYKILFNYNANFKKTVACKIIEFDDKHIAFNIEVNKTLDFLTDHLAYKEPCVNYFTNLLIIDQQNTPQYSNGEETIVNEEYSMEESDTESSDDEGDNMVEEEAEGYVEEDLEEEDVDSIS